MKTNDMDKTVKKQNNWQAQLITQKRIRNNNNNKQK